MAFKRYIKEKEKNYGKLNNVNERKSYEHDDYENGRIGRGM